MAQHGRHASPDSRGIWAVSTGRPRHGNHLPTPLSATLLGLTAVGLGLLSVAPPAAMQARAVPLAASAPSPIAVAALAPAARLPALEAELRDERDRASRQRRTAAARASAAATATPSPKPAPVPSIEGCRTGRMDTFGVNGALPGRVLCTLPGGSGERLRADAAQAFVRLDAAFEQAMGRKLCVIDGYRPIGEQRLLRRVKPRFAARPGYSEHGWGLAVDLGCGLLSSRSAQSRWMKAHAADYGWIHPEWARPGGSRPEPWHWEYVPR